MITSETHNKFYSIKIDSYQITKKTLQNKKSAFSSENKTKPFITAFISNKKIKT